MLPEARVCPSGLNATVRSSAGVGMMLRVVFSAVVAVSNAPRLAVGSDCSRCAARVSASA